MPMPMAATLSELLPAWWELQQQTLARLHPSWLAEYAAELLQRACAERIGRRWLAQRLAVVSPLLFGALPEGPPPAHGALRRAGWLEPLLRQPAGRALELGVRALAPALRTVVDREGVLTLRRAFGAARCEAALRMAPQELPLPLRNAFAACAMDGERLMRFAQDCGLRELAHYAAGLHPAWGESARLSFERRCFDPALPPVLPPAQLEALLQEAASD